MKPRIKIEIPLFVALIALVAVIIGVLTAGVGAQIVFPEGTQQTTAPRVSAPPPGAAFAEVVPFGPFDTLVPISVGGVPAGRELVVLQVNMSGYFPGMMATLESRLPSPNEANDPILLTLFHLPHLGASGEVNRDQFNFPDGTVTVDEGRQLWFQFLSFDLAPIAAGKQSGLSVLGYYRDRR